MKKTVCWNYFLFIKENDAFNVYVTNTYISFRMFKHIRFVTWEKARTKQCRSRSEKKNIQPTGMLRTQVKIMPTHMSLVP